MQTPPTTGPLGKLLVIDDNEVILRALDLAMTQRNYQVFKAGEIATALHILRTELPELILLDINFPMDTTVFSGGARDGFWALDWIKRLREANGVPIIVISGDAPEKSEAHALGAGAAAYFCKPIDNDRLAARIAELLAKKP